MHAAMNTWNVEQKTQTHKCERKQKMNLAKLHRTTQGSNFLFMLWFVAFGFGMHHRLSSVLGLDRR